MLCWCLPWFMRKCKQSTAIAVEYTVFKMFLFPHVIFVMSRTRVSMDFTHFLESAAVVSDCLDADYFRTSQTAIQRCSKIYDHGRCFLNVSNFISETSFALSIGRNYEKGIFDLLLGNFLFFRDKSNSICCHGTLKIDWKNIEMWHKT